MTKIMYVEDDADTRNMVKTLLEKEGFIVSVVRSGAEGMVQLEKDRPDLIILDMMLPDMSGWDVFNKIVTHEIDYRVEHSIGENEPFIKIIFLSVIPMPKERIRKMHEYGIADYITKPFDSRALVRRIRKLLNE
jgi:two-component system response regulator VicR